MIGAVAQLVQFLYSVHESLGSIPTPNKPYVEVPTYNLSTWEV